MISCFGVTTVFFSIWITNTIIQDAFAFTDIDTSPCRISGITVIKDKKGSGFSFSEANAICGELGLTLASKAQIENARKHGFETCNFGWVREQYIVISRIIPNSKCGRNKTGVLVWRVQDHHKTVGYCFNSSDTWVDSCIPEDAGTTALPETSTETNATSTVELQDTSALAQTSESPQTKRSPKFRLKCVTETIPPPTTEEPTPHTANRVAFPNDRVIFGGVPTALLVLALIFFAAAAVLAVCYIKRYKKMSPLSNKKEKKEAVETKDIKETKTSGKTSEQELKKNGKKAEESQAKLEPPVKCLEAEV
ncbi:lymphatic vessel endothelial hyaluronic acid receptor 1 [Tiliqua scincoides]|uniref:lymphatic vessel endothelial hyaluronic acid receptor 1 n=1 Tax=Tiliqua scincoides TaxID=71010 RepID=UPI003462EF90